MPNNNFLITNDCNFSGVYVILNLSNCKCYIGSSRNIERRLKEHETQLRKGIHKVVEMQADYNENNRFIAYVLSSVPLGKFKYNADKNLRFYENEAIKLFETLNPEKGYNKVLTSDDKSEEFSNIYWKKVAFDTFVSYKERKPCFRCGDKQRKEEINSFIDKMLGGK